MWQRAAACILPAPQPSLKGLTASAGSKFWEPPFPFGTSLVAQLVKNLPEMQETWVLSLGCPTMTQEQ